MLKVQAKLLIYKIYVKNFPSPRKAASKSLSLFMEYEIKGKSKSCSRHEDASPLWESDLSLRRTIEVFNFSVKWEEKGIEILRIKNDVLSRHHKAFSRMLVYPRDPETECREAFGGAEARGEVSMM